MRWFDAAERGLTRICRIRWYEDYEYLLWLLQLWQWFVSLWILNESPSGQGYLTKRNLSGHINKDYENDLLMESQCWWPLDAPQPQFFFERDKKMQKFYDSKLKANSVRIASWNFWGLMILLLLNIWLGCLRSVYCCIFFNNLS